MKDKLLNNMLYELRSDFKKTTELLENKIQSFEDDKEDIDQTMLDALNFVIHLKDLWSYPDKVSECHENEAQALSEMERVVRKAISKATGEN